MAESGLSASAFTARVVASTRASLAASVLAAWCAFTGALHGGAPGPTLDMLDAAEAEADLESWLEAKLRAGERLMGFGHRVFRGNDPRAEAMRRRMQAMGPHAGRLAFADRLEKAVAVAIERVKPGRTLPPNVEIMAALLLDAVGIPREAFTLVFAVGRSAGWLAHAMEQQKTGRMIRPVSAYVGPPIVLRNLSRTTTLVLWYKYLSNSTRHTEVVMIFRQLFDATSGTYTYLLASRRGGEALIVDPVLEKVDRYLSLIRELDLRLVKAVDTHLHADHITGLGALRDSTRCITVMGEQSSVDVVSMRLSDGDTLRIEGWSWRRSTRPATPTIPTVSACRTGSSPATRC